ncbi:hypothetical protein ACFWYW_28595 [Nonomuraea sp. NPDC059023]
MLDLVLLWVLPWLLLVATALHGKVLSTRKGRMLWWGALFGVAPFALLINLSTLLANLDVPTWRQARMPGFLILLVLVLPLGVGLLAAWLGRGSPDPRPAPASEPPKYTLLSGQRIVWVARTTNRALLAASVILTVVSAALAVWMLGDAAELVAVLMLSLISVTLLGVGLSSVRVRVTSHGVVIGFGPLAWPQRRIALSVIERAWAERRSPSSVGGWGLRGSTIMLRGGDCLVIDYRSGGQLAVSIDDAERGASLINALVSKQTA